MLPGGMMPVTQLVAMVRGTPPKDALGLLTALPAERLPIVLAEMPGPDLARLLPVAGAADRDRLITALADDQLVDLIRTLPADRTHTLVSRLPTDRLQRISDRLPLPALVALPDDRQRELLVSMRPDQARDVRVVAYERGVRDALVRANAKVADGPVAPPGVLLVWVLGWWVAVAPRFGDDGRVGVRDAEDAASRIGANAALSVTNHEPALEVIDYCTGAQRQGRPVTATWWHDDRHDMDLKRSLVSLLRS